ncbi:hypothetical protein H2201_007706 [Coniosporium apollinis]|uniref:Uncharacterized protein n=1 Tax=Coniosporium apollinis TaxID=61459 RepID=A0ABQ9NLT9_9PEZI|nr:hypothetical protein H2201_007706 [Coniosporium apollinis]
MAAAEDPILLREQTFGLGGITCGFSHCDFRGPFELKGDTGFRLFVLLTVNCSTRASLAVLFVWSPHRNP